ncbi:G-type lectin S-receptor-like serine/threonine-protein kinase At1g11330 [Vitis riparia]|uniref:G-type lectin S-receptor-like serine/threonine-protein kinase At1g11330 n=1 Tax=Vitis riparia TaxID=96939 RepID=UPI00155A3FCB|nr:G-type lectin S-receptor-like serine/threonine-protein kinase At1g11330 [Vitis riparia]
MRRPSVRPVSLLLTCFWFVFGCSAIDTITSTHFIKDPETIVSSGRVFKLGFFSLDGSSNRYVGIWYNTTSLLTIIWVANRDRPLNDSSGVLTISEDGNIQVLNGRKEILWSSNVSNPAGVNSSAQLQDSGNLVLRDNNGVSVWESLQNPSHSFVPQMKISTNTRTGVRKVLTSWKSSSDPSMGSFTAGVEPLNIPQVFIWNGSRPYWRSGPWDGQILTGVDVKWITLDGLNIVDDKEGTVYITFAYPDSGFFYAYVLTPEGILVETSRDKRNEDWKRVWKTKENECEIYGKCGPFGHCNSRDSPICSCLKGYEPKHTQEWNRGNWTGGCVRKTPLQCERTKNGSEEAKVDGFLKLTNMKVPDLAEQSYALEDDCRQQCLRNCSCIAYSYHTGIGCMWWSGDLIDIQKLSSTGAHLFIRVAHSELKQDRKRGARIIVIVTVIIGTIAIALCTYFLRRWIAKQRAKKRKIEEILSFNRGKFSDPSVPGDGVNQVKLEELPLIDFNKLSTATNNFHEANKLGQGGFGPVYRGKLAEGQDIAVKRLSRASTQGLEEFMNEVVVISKLQHRNLVRLIGCCIEGDEKMLIYEFMPNKSLDASLFDPVKRQLLDWRTRFKIIEGIGRGLLYLHRDSRLRIIHRDLKAGNILLDEDLNPKISDFGMARIFGSDQDQANTKRVVGTYGYMSPEYAMQGRFSEKSDVFSFGVLLLEIVSGRKNSSFYHEEYFTLLGYAWKLWKEDNMKTLIDGSILEACFQEEILRCIHVGLLCVQELAKDRPSISTVVGMICSEIAHLPPPKQPAFTEMRSGINTESSDKKCSLNKVSITMIEGR